MSDFEVVRGSFFQLQENIRRLDGVDRSAEESENEYKLAGRRLNRARNEFNQRSADLEISGKKVAQAKKNAVRKVLNRKKYEEKVAEWEQTRQMDIQHLNAQRKALEIEREGQRRARDSLQRSREAISRRNELDARRKELLEQTFQGPVGDFEENRLEQERNQLRTQFNSADEVLKRQSQCVYWLRQSRDKMADLNRNLRAARSNNTLDLFTGPGAGGLISGYAGLQTNQYIRDAAALAKLANVDFRKAREFNPSIADAQSVSVQFGDFLALANILFDNLITDLIVRTKIQKAVQSAKAVTAQIERIYEEQLHVKAKYATSVRQIKQRLEQVERDLEAERIRLMYSYPVVVTLPSPLGAGYQPFNPDVGSYTHCPGEGSQPPFSVIASHSSYPVTASNPPY